MLFGNRGHRSSDKRQRRSEAYRPLSEELEPKLLLATLQLGAGTPINLAGQTTVAPNGPQTIGGQLPFIADSTGFGANQTQGTQTTDPGLGVLETGGLSSQGAGYSVAALGDMNGDGSNDFLIGAPGVTRSGSTITAASVQTSQAFLVFGNRSASVPNVQSWLSSTPEQRVGLLGAPGPGLGTTQQFNPFTNRGQPFNYNFDGVSFITSASPNSQLGAFVAAAGPNAFVIGAPNYAGGGRLYYILASSSFNQATLRSAPIDLDNPQNYPTLTIVTFEETVNPTTSGLGASFADLPSVFGDGQDTIAIGEPGASFNGKTGNGAVFLFPVSSLPTTLGGTNIVQVQASKPFTIVGANSGDGAGFSIADAGDVNGATVTGAAGTNINDLLIGAPFFRSNQGAAYLVYGGKTLTSAIGNGFTNVDLSRLEITPVTTVGASNFDPTPPQGAVFVGSGGGVEAGYSVSGAGDFNRDGFADFMIGSPLNGVGLVSLFYGQPTGAINSTGQFTQGLITPTANTSAPNPITLGTPPIFPGTFPATPTNNGTNTWFTGVSGGSRAGWSISAVGALGSNTPNPILIGAPSAGGQTGTAGQGTVYEAVSIPGTTANPFPAKGGFSLADTRIRQYTLAYPTNFPTQGDAIGFGQSVSSFSGSSGGDFIAGAPGYSGTLVTTTASPPTPLVGAGAMVLQSLQPANTLIPLGGGSGGGGGGGGGGSSGGAIAGAVPPGLFVPPDFVPPFGSSFVPTVTALSALSSYAPIPLNVALNQYLPPDGFAQRIYLWHHPGANVNPPLGGRTITNSGKPNKGRGVFTLSTTVFTRGRFHAGKTLKWTHSDLHGHTPGRVIPANAVRQQYTDAGSHLKV
jgi:hypothetical protein